ncbi:hypothetical protein GH714_043660 [Hevea brasiliensis]|uniref:O-methyltransferase domain-containing protein n=1 Tax=Hevea brasiliensis TaxID=3981 RepID=A0A6A6K775_HEVBR|nr:hypothetical protein GH714_043660 [Hevea brasiliensis]
MVNLADANHDAELLQAQAHVWNHIFNFINSMSLKCAIQLGIPDVIHNHGKPITLSQLISSLPVHPAKARSIPRLMRLLVHSGFFAQAKISEDDDQEEAYVLTSASQLLLKDNPLSVTPFLMTMLDPILTRPWHYCEGAFEGLKSLVDVGGGTGTVAKAIAKAFPQLDCIVFDLPHVVAGLQGTDNLKYVGGNLFEEIPPSDAILLKWILHDWSDKECVKIMKQCKEAIKGREGGKLIIIDMVIGSRKKDKDAMETQLFFDMLMMALVTGQGKRMG